MTAQERLWNQLWQRDESCPYCSEGCVICEWTGRVRLADYLVLASERSKQQSADSEHEIDFQWLAEELGKALCNVIGIRA